MTKLGDKTAFRNKDSGVIQTEHPGVQFFQDLYKSKKIRKDLTFDKVKAIVRQPTKKFLIDKFIEGIAVFFVPDENSFMTQRAMLKKKIQEALDKMKNISNQQLSKINEERERIFNEKGEEYRRANEKINSELLTIFNKFRNS